MADTNVPKPKRKAYQPPKLETVEVVAEEALLALCAFGGGTPQVVMQGAPCETCKS